jgi:hypothetical protein
MDEGAVRNWASLFEEAYYGGPQGRVPLMGNLEDVCRLQIWASLSLGPPLCLKGAWNQKWGETE